MERAQAKNSYGNRSVRRAKHMDETERNALIVQYAPLVKFLASRMAMRVPPSVSLDDMISAGIMGLLDAIDKFDPSREIQFKTYAEFRIRGAMLDELRNMDWVPRSTRKKIHTMERAITAVEAKLGRPAEDFEIAEEMGVDLDTYYKILNKSRGIELLSLDEYIKGDKSSGEPKKSFRSLIQGNDDPGRYIMASELKHVIAEAIRTLAKKEQIVISLYYYDELTLKEIGQILGLTESRISQIHTKSVIKLRAKLSLYYEAQ
jgi:RNA polymerase sigma factor for flagellar operon FliA